MEKSQFSEELAFFLSNLRDVMLSAGRMTKMLPEKAIEEWHSSQDFRDEVMNNQSVLLPGIIIGVGLGLLVWCCGGRNKIDYDYDCDGDCD